MQAEMPFFDTPEKAVEYAVSMLGGTKRVGALLWPDKSPDVASRQLAASLHPSRAEKLDLSQAMYVLRLARDAGCYAPFQWLAGECGFDANPITKAEEMDRVTSVVEASTKTLAAAVAALERMQRARAVA